MTRLIPHESHHAPAPTQRIRIVAPLAPGGTPSTPGRATAAELTKAFGQPYMMLMNADKACKTTVLAWTRTARSAALSDVPTVEQAGAQGVRGQRLARSAGPGRHSARDCQRHPARGGQGHRQPSGNTPQEFAKLIDSGLKKWAPIVKISGATVD